MPRVLVIEDTDEIRELIEISLSRAGMEIDSATDGVRGLELMRSVAPDAVVLDLNLPGRDGVSLCREIREFSQVPILVASGDDTLDRRERSKSAGANDFIGKPFSPRDLVDRVRSLLSQADAAPGSGV
jgi:two-component system, OmpR family, response regulator